MKKPMLHKLAIFISFIFAHCISGAAAFSCTQISKTSFRYYSENDKCGTRVSSSTRTHPLSLYKDHRQNEGLPPVFSSFASSDSWKSEATVHGMDLPRVGSSPSPVEKLSKSVSKMFGFVADVLVKEPIARSPPPILDENEFDEEVTSDHEPYDQSISQVQVISLVDINWLKAHEEVVSEERVQSLRNAIVGWDAYKLPLLVDSHSGAILDGHHRYAVGCHMGLSRLPAILVDYMNDDSISVDVWPECGVDCLTKNDVVEMSLSDRVYPPKTSKHDFVSSFTTINVPLSTLR
jgi:hypothetical protein